MATYLSLEAPENVLVLLEAHRSDVFGRLFQNGIPHPAQSLTRDDIEKSLSSPFPPVLAGSGIGPLLKGLTFEEAIPCVHGANALAYGFFKNPAIARDTSAFYVRGAAISSRSPIQTTRNLQ